MASNDPAFLWETEALRKRRGGRSETQAQIDSGWVTLRAAHDATGVPIDTLRKWGRRGTVPSTVVDSDGRQRRLVQLESVVALARSQGRPPAAAGEAPVPTPAAAPPAPGTMIVPIDAWDKMLMQLGNLHEAGQQLAEARERAAKAETEAAFLRERLAELRTPADIPESVPEPQEISGPSREDGVGSAPEEGRSPRAWWHQAKRRWQGRGNR